MVKMYASTLICYASPIICYLQSFSVGSYLKPVVMVMLTLLFRHFLTCPCKSVMGMLGHDINLMSEKEFMGHTV